MQPIVYESELTHYGVLGMRWGVHRAVSKQQRQAKLQKKALNLDKKASALTKKSEKIHAEQDLERANKKAVKAANWDKKASKLAKKALKSDSELDRALYERRSERLKYKAAKARIEGNTMSKTKAYSAKAMKYAVKSDVVAAKAARARKKLATDKYYIEKMKRKVSTLTDEELATGYAFVNALKTG